ncbi:MAG: DUF3048 domain-containing protein [Patescibacteria group bacterium]
MPSKNKIISALLILGFIAILAEVAWLVAKSPDFLERLGLKYKIPSVSLILTPRPPLYLSQFDGMPVSSTAEQIPEVLGVMIDNHPDARPQAGLSQARVVYEAPVEGGLTRYFALFNSSQIVAKVGPVRSARPYFLDWLAEYGRSSYWHSGGSSDALSLIKQYAVWDVNEFYLGPYFWRSSDREAPHNLYTNSEKWNTLIAGTPHDSSGWLGWNFGKNSLASASSSEVADLKINLYGVGWSYDADLGRYVRSINNRAMFDEAGQKILADTVAVQFVDTDVIDEEGRRTVTTVGEGEARFVRDGRMWRATWRKADRASRTRFYDAGGNELSFKPGQIWIEVIPQNTTIEVSS